MPNESASPPPNCGGRFAPRRSLARATVDVDRTAWLDLFGEAWERFNWRCHAYCQMTNHYPVVVEMP